MRYVDISELQVPANWQARADQALNGLRDEIAQADAAALAAGQDRTAARKAAIRAGLAIQARSDLWRELGPELKKLGDGKCWYSESRNPTADKNVDHFRPKAKVVEDDAHEGYWWLAFRWQNYRYASQWCNQHRNDKINNTSGGKADHFPLRPGSLRAYAEADDCELEDIELLDPVDPEDWKLLTFRSDGYPIPVSPAGTPEHARAARSIDVYHLHCRELVDERRPLAGMVQRIVEEMERIQPGIATDAHLKGFYKRQLIELLKLIQKRADYSAAALAYARAEIYKLEGGHQVKRDWLEQILNSNP
jgi:hypothetical protein